MHIGWYHMHMRASLAPLIVMLLVLSGAPGVRAQELLTAGLSLGARGTQVTLLQQMLNRDPDTHITNIGPGSPGNETDYFGTLTRAAVVRFQVKYASEVLAPIGLTQGSGYVGLYTRIKLNSLSSLAANTSYVAPQITFPVVTSVPVVVSPPLAVPAAQPASPGALQNPNLKNLDVFLAAIDKSESQKGLSAAAIANIKEIVKKTTATTTDLRAEFLRQVQNNSHQSVDDTSLTGRVFAGLTQVFYGIFMPEHARAAASIPFGGAILFTYPCCGTWLITLEPLPPSYAALLTYTPFSQAYLSYNIPFTTWLLGEYEPGAGVCQTGVYCDESIDSEGMIIPIVGSSPS